MNNFYSKFKIKNFRSFGESAQELNLAIPEESKAGSGITYIVGANNSGKTTLIESLILRDKHIIRDSENRGSGPEFELYDNGGSLVRGLKKFREISNTLTEDPVITDNEKLFEIISSRRNWESVVDLDRESSFFIGRSIEIKDIRKNQDIHVASLLKSIEVVEERYKEFNELVKRVVPDFLHWSIGNEDHEYVKYISNDGKEHKSDFLGDGIISILRILAHLFENQARPLVIDEPELSLHPMAQKRLIKVIAEYAKERQIIIATHSPYFVDFEYLKNGAKINRCVKKRREDAKIFTLGDISDYAGLISSENWQQPYLFDVVAKEIFFIEDGVIFLEGQEDVGLLKDRIEHRDLNVFGYGVRGCGNFKFALSLAKDLGFEKVGVFIDQGNDEDKIKCELENKFPEYKIIQWEKEDIRDKEKYTNKEKEGYFNKDGSIKQNEEKDLNSKLSEMAESLIEE